MFGRVYELGMVMKYNLLTGQPLKDISLGAGAFRVREKLLAAAQGQGTGAGEEDNKRGEEVYE